MRRTLTVMAAAFAAVAIAACDSGTTNPEDVSLNHAGPPAPGETTNQQGHFFVCKEWTDATSDILANFEITADGGVTVTPFSLAAGDCTEAYKTPPLGAQVDVVVTELSSPDYGLDQVERSISLQQARPPKTKLLTGPAVTTLDFNGDTEVTLTFYNSATTQGGGEGCTPGYWKNHTSIKNNDAWVGTGLAIGDPYDGTFVVTSTFGGTLLDALRRGGGREKALGRHATAALLNSLSSGVSYALTSAEVLQIVQAAYGSGDFNDAKNLLAAENEMGCPL